MRVEQSSMDKLRAWTTANRFVRNLTCAEQNSLQIEPGQRNASTPQSH
jgi:hypothetical protein